MLAASFAFATWGLPASAQTAYTWNGTSGGTGAWATSGNWTPSGVPGGNTGDSATISQTATTTSAIELVTLGSTESIASLTFNQSSTGTIDLLLGGTTTLTLSNASTLALGGNSTGTELMYLDGIDYAKNMTYAGNINVGTNGILEMGASGNTTEATAAVTGTLQVQSGGVLNVDRPIYSLNAANVNINGAATIASGGTVNFNSVNSGNGSGVTTALVATGTQVTALRFNVNGSFTAASGSTINATTTGSQTLGIYLTAANSGTLTFASAVGSGGTFFNAANEVNEGIFFTGTAQNYSILSNNNLPAVSLLPTGTYTSAQPVNITIGTPNGTSTLTIANLNYQAPLTAAATYAGTLEITLNSNLTLTGNLNASNHGTAGETFILNTNGYTFDQSTYGAIKSANVNNAASNWIYEGGGTLKATYYDLSVATGTGGSSVVGATTLWASGTGTTNLGNAAGGTIDPTSTFKFAGAGATTGSLTTTAGGTNRAIGRVLVGDGTNTSALNLASNITGQGDITVNAKGSLYLNGFNYTESSAATSNAGGLTSAGTGTAVVANNGGGTATLTLDATHGSGSFAGLIEDHASGTGTLALALTGTGTQTLASANTYSGGTSVNSGSLILSNTSGSATGTGALNVAAGATLGGSGLSSSSSFSIGGTGSQANVLVGITSASDTNTTHTLTLLGSGSNSITNTTLQFNLSAATPGQGTELNVGASTLALSGSTLALNVQGTGVIPGYSPYVLIAGTGSNQYTGLVTQVESINGQLYDVITGGLTLSFAPSLANTWYANNSFLFLNTAGGVDDIEVSVVPEPGTWAMMLGGLAVLVCWQRRRSRASRL